MVKKKPQIAGSGRPRVQMPRRATSGAFNQLNPAAIKQLKDSFTLLDKDGDGIISKEDLEEMLISLGQDADEKHVAEMFDSFGSSLTFSAYLTAMSSDMSRLSSKQELMQAFEAFKEDNNGRIDVGELEELLLEQGMDTSDIEGVIRPFSNAHGFNYRDFVGILHADE